MLTKGFFVLTDVLEQLEISQTMYLGRNPVKCKTLGLVFAVNALGIQKKQQKEGTLSILNTQRNMWLLVQRTCVESLVADFSITLILSHLSLSEAGMLPYVTEIYTYIRWLPLF